MFLFLQILIYGLQRKCSSNELQVLLVPFMNDLLFSFLKMHVQSITKVKLDEVVWQHTFGRSHCWIADSLSQGQFYYIKYLCSFRLSVFLASNSKHVASFNIFIVAVCKKLWIFDRKYAYIHFDLLLLWRTLFGSTSSLVSLVVMAARVLYETILFSGIWKSN